MSIGSFLDRYHWQIMCMVLAILLLYQTVTFRDEVASRVDLFNSVLCADYILSQRMDLNASRNISKIIDTSEIK